MPNGRIRKQTRQLNPEVLALNYSELRVFEIIDAVKTCHSFDSFKNHFKLMVQNFSSSHARAILRVLLFRSGLYTKDQLLNLASESAATLFITFKNLLPSDNLRPTKFSDFSKKLILRLSVEIDYIFDYYNGALKANDIDAIAMANKDDIAIHQSKTIRALRPKPTQVSAFLKSINAKIEPSDVAHCAGYTHFHEKSSSIPIVLLVASTEEKKTTQTSQTLPPSQPPQPPKPSVTSVDTTTEDAEFLYNFSLYPKVLPPLPSPEELERFAFVDNEFVAYKNKL